MMQIASPINSEKRALWRQDNIKNNSLQSHRSLRMLNKRRERHDGQEQEVSVPTEREARTRHYTSFCDVILWVYDGSHITVLMIMIMSLS
jgi:hypothetical protein